MKAIEVYALLFFQLFCMFKNIFTEKLRGCPSTDGRIKHVGSLHTVKYPSAVKRGEVRASAWMNLENIVPLKDARHRTRHVT